MVCTQGFSTQMGSDSGAGQVPCPGSLVRAVELDQQGPPPFFARYSVLGFQRLPGVLWVCMYIHNVLGMWGHLSTHTLV